MNNIEVRLKDCAAQENCDSEEYDLMQEAAREIETLRTQLAKANERVRELEKELKESEDDLDAAEQQLSSYENALEEVQAVFVDSDACPLFEPFNPRNLSAWLNKFAIENQVKGAEALIYAFPLNASDQMKKWVEQLLKELE